MMVGLCECGCGQTTRLATITSTAKGWTRGHPLRFVFGHGTRKTVPKGYAVRDGIRVHRRRAERALGKPLPIGAEVHHVDGTKSVTSALVICQDHAYHRLLHARTRIVRTGGNPNTDRICCECQRLLPIATGFYGDGNQCRDCQHRRQRLYRAVNLEKVRAYEREQRLKRRMSR